MSHVREIPGVKIIEGAAHLDARGGFVRSLSLGDLDQGVLESGQPVLAHATNLLRGTLRGLHYQEAPFDEVKLVWCSRGTILDVLVDLRATSPTFGDWMSVTLSDDDALTILVPPGVAHGYQTLEESSTVSYLIFGTYEPSSGRVIRWDDPAVGISWPLEVTSISEQDSSAELCRLNF